MFKIIFSETELLDLRVLYDKRPRAILDRNICPYDNYLFEIINGELPDDLKIRILASIRMLEHQNAHNMMVSHNSLLELLGFSREQQISRAFKLT